MMITASDYKEWCRLAGLYLGNESHAQCYKAYQEKLCRQGVYVRVVDDFLDDNQGGIDIPSWRSYSVYEMSGDLPYRLNLTADALTAVGATRAAAKVRTAQDNSPTAMLMQHADDMDTFMQMMRDGMAAQMMGDLQKNIARALPEEAAKMGLPVPGSEPVPVDAECETWEEIEHLLAQYVSAHQSALQQDYARHGDPRQQPGFDPQTRMAQLETIRTAEYQVEFQNDEADKLHEHLAAFETTLRGKGRRKVRSWRRKILAVYRMFSDRDESTLTPALRKAMAAARRVMNEHRDLFFPKAIDDEDLTRRLAAIGDYTVDPDGSSVNVNWERPAALHCELGPFGIHIEFPAGDADHLRQLLDRIDRLIADFPRIAAEIHERVLSQFADRLDFFEDWELEDYRLDADGNISDEAILAHAGPGTFNISIPEWDDGRSVWTELYMNVEWDEEHGLEMEFPE